jgi:phage tail-like protein
MPDKAEGTLQDEELVGSWFGVEFKNGIEGHFSEVTGLGMEIEVVEYTDTAVDTLTRKRPGTTKYSEMGLKRTLTKDKSFWDWTKRIRDGGMDYRTEGSIVLHNMNGDEVGRWNFVNAWPSKWSASDLDVSSDDLIQEDITIQIERLERSA